MKKKFFFAAVALVALASCTSDEIIGDSPTQNPEKASNAIVFTSGTKAITRGDLYGATAAEKIGGMFVVEGTKGSEAANAPSSDVVFDNYLVGYTANTAGRTESNSNNWEYVGLQTGITDRMTASTWSALHPAAKTAVTVQSIKYWDYSQDQYDFIAWSTGTCEAVTTAASAGKVQVTRINTGADLSSTAVGKGGFTLSAASADDLLQCYYTDITTVTKASGNYGKPVTLKFKNMASKVRVALYETVPGYSVKDVKFYEAEAADPAAPDDLGTNTVANATLFTTGTDALPQSGDVLVYYPHIGSGNNAKEDYNKASVTVSAGSGASATSTTQAFGPLTAQYTGAERNEASSNIYLGRTLPNATFAGVAANAFYQAVIPNNNGYPLTLRLDYTLVATDGSGEEIKVYGAKAVVPSTYTVWQPNYAYTYIFKISDNSNGWTSAAAASDPAGLFPITFDAVVASFVDTNAEQTTVTTVATPSITTYQQGHDHANKDEYSKSQKAGKDQTNVKDVYVQVMDNSGATPTLKADLNGTDKSLLYLIEKNNADYVASEAEVMDALQNRTNTPTGTAKAYDDDDPVGRNGITLTKNSNISNTETQIVNGVDDQPITEIAGVAISAGQVAKIDIDHLDAGTYAYVYSTPPTSEEKIYNVVSISTDAEARNYYEVALDGTETPIASGDATTTAQAGYVYFFKNVDETGAFVSYTFKQTKVGDSVVGLVGVAIPGSKASTYTAGHFYFDVYYQNNGTYAVKVIKVVN